MAKRVVSDSRLFDFYENSLKQTREFQTQHSKWLINTLYLLHSGAIVGLLSKTPFEKLPQLTIPLWWFASGLSLAFLAGFATWTNYRYAINAHVEALKAIKGGTWKGESSFNRRVMATQVICAPHRLYIVRFPAPWCVQHALLSRRP